MIDDKVFPPVKSDEDLARGVKIIGEALPELAADEVQADTDELADNHDLTGLDEAYPSELLSAVATIVRGEPVKAVLWAAVVGIAIGLLTSK